MSCLLPSGSLSETQRALPREHGGPERWLLPSVITVSKHDELMGTGDLLTDLEAPSGTIQILPGDSGTRLDEDYFPVAESRKKGAAMPPSENCGAGSSGSTQPARFEGRFLRWRP